MKLVSAAAIAFLASVSLATAADVAKPLPPAVIEQLNLAAKLADYGTAHKDPLLLIAAARVMKGLSPDAPAAQKAMSADDLLKAARTLAGKRQDLIDLADDVAAESSKGLCPGPGTTYGCF